MTTPAPAPLARRRPFPVRRSPEQLSCLGLLHLAESALEAAAAHPDMASGLAPMARAQVSQTLTLRRMQAAHVARQRGERLESGVIEAVAVEVTETRCGVAL